MLLNLNILLKMKLSRSILRAPREQRGMAVVAVVIVDSEGQRGQW